MAKWHTRTLSICDDNYKSNWPDFISDEEVKKDISSKYGLDNKRVIFTAARLVPKKNIDGG